MDFFIDCVTKITHGKTKKIDFVELCWEFEFRKMTKQNIYLYILYSSLFVCFRRSFSHRRTLADIAFRRIGFDFRPTVVQKTQ